MDPRLIAMSTSRSKTLSGNSSRGLLCCPCQPPLPYAAPASVWSPTGSARAIRWSGTWRFEDAGDVLADCPVAAVRLDQDLLE